MKILGTTCNLLRKYTHRQLVSTVASKYIFRPQNTQTFIKIHTSNVVRTSVKMAPVDTSPATQITGNFELLCSLRATNDVPVHKYRSSKTGITVVIAEVEGPAVSGYFCLVTEAHDHDGLPHTLEHLIFLGSENYPYKGVLDLLANRCLASGTNAWTDTDHTAYTIRTAGSEGFLALMPIYLDHILFPTLTDSGFITEVHHVTKEGKDAGVVYCEMEDVDNNGDSKVHRTLLEHAYPGDCGYKSQTGGKLKNLRESTTNEKVRDYHKTFYRPENLTLIINGQIKPEDVLKSLEAFEEKIVNKGPREPFTRPWQSVVPPLTESVNTEVHFPTDKEDNGLVYVGWRGPSAVTEYEKFVALIVLLKYLTDTSVSPLRKKFVDVEDPLASEVSYSPIENSESLIMLQFENVPIAKLDYIKDRLESALSAIAKDVEPIDMERIATVIHRKRLDCLSALESNPHECIAFMIIGDMLYGNTKQDLELRLNEVKLLDKLKKEDIKFWKALLQQYLVDAPSVVVRGVPSIKEQKRLEEEDATRIKQRRQELRDDGLAKKDKELLDAIDENERPPPPEVLTSLSIPSLDSIHYHPIKRYTTDSEEQHPNFDARDAPVYMQVDNIHSNFVYMFVLMDSHELDKKQRLYLPLLLELLLESPINRNGATISYEQVISQLERDTAEVATHIGFESSSRFEAGPYAQTPFLKIQVEPEKYKLGITWLRELLYHTIITEERIRIVATKLVNEASQVKRKGNFIVKELMKGILYHDNSNHYAVSILRQFNFLNKLIASLSTPEEAKVILDDMNSVLKHITNPENIVVHLACNLDQLASKVYNPSSHWTNLLPENSKPAKRKFKSMTDYELMQSDLKTNDLSCVAGIGSVKSAFYCQTVPAIKDFLDKDLAPLLVFLQYLTQLEGPLWRKVRGQGLAYSYSMIPRPNEGLLYLTFYRATDVIGSYKEALLILKETLAEDNWDQTLFECAKSSLLYEIIEREKTVSDVIVQSQLAYFRNVGYEYNRNLVKQISEVNLADLKGIGKKYITSLLDVDKSKITIVTDPAKIKDVASAFQGFGKNLTVFDSLEDSYLNHS